MKWMLKDRLDDRGTPCGIDVVDYWREDHVVCRLPDGASVGGGQAWPEQRRNASLISAAPYLLAACRHALARLKALPHKYSDTDFTLIEGAIKQAEGVES